MLSEKRRKNKMCGRSGSRKMLGDVRAASEPRCKIHLRAAIFVICGETMIREPTTVLKILKDLTGVLIILG